MTAKARTIKLPDGSAVSALWQKPKDAKAVLVLAHGAGAGMTHKHMAATADGLEARGVATLRYNFLYMEHGGKRPDAPKLAQLVDFEGLCAAGARMLGLDALHTQHALAISGSMASGLMAAQEQNGGWLTDEMKPISALPSSSV